MGRRRRRKREKQIEVSITDYMKLKGAMVKKIWKKEKRQ
jgi:hypothetical protein